MKTISLIAVLVAASAPTLALAHHSFAAFDRSKKVVLVGKVKEFSFTNPHAWIQLEVQAANGDKTEWGVNLCKAVGSPRFKLLYDIYHMQIMEGDVIYTVKKYKDYIAHYHTGGVPGRAEIDESQELNYPAIVKAILDTNYEGHLGQEFIPRRDAIQSLAQGFRICDV